MFKFALFSILEKLHNPIRERFNGHRSHLKAEVGNCKILCDHFNEGLCKYDSYKVQILQKCDDNIAMRDRKLIETKWMLKLRTVFPYGMNDQIQPNESKKKKLEEDPIISSKYPALKRNRNRGPRKRKPFNKNNSMNSFLILLSNLLKNDLKSCMNFIRSVLYSFSKSKLKALFCQVTDFLEEQGNDFVFQSMVQGYS